MVLSFLSRTDHVTRSFGRYIFFRPNIFGYDLDHLYSQIVAIKETLALFMELQVLTDKPLKELAFSHIIHSIKRMNQKHKNETENRALQSILFSMLQVYTHFFGFLNLFAKLIQYPTIYNILFMLLQEEDEKKATRSLVTICDLHKRKVWFDDRTANAICWACFHPSSRFIKSNILILCNMYPVSCNKSRFFVLPPGL